MTSQRWSVQLALADSVANRISGGDTLRLAWRLNERVYEVSIGGLNGRSLSADGQERTWHNSDVTDDVAGGLPLPDLVVHAPLLEVALDEQRAPLSAVAYPESATPTPGGRSPQRSREGA